MHKTYRTSAGNPRLVLCSLTLILSACAADPPPQPERSRPAPMPVIQAASTVTTAPAEAATQEAFRLPLTNNDDRPIYFLSDDSFVFVIVSDHDSRMKMRIQVVGEQEAMICNELIDTQVWHAIPTEIAVPVRQNFGVEPHARCTLSVRVRVLSQDCREAVRFRLYPHKIQFSRPRDPRETPDDAQPSASPPSNDDPRGMREF